MNHPSQSYRAIETDCESLPLQSVSIVVSSKPLHTTFDCVESLPVDCFPQSPTTLKMAYRMSYRIPPEPHALQKRSTKAK